MKRPSGDVLHRAARFATLVAEKDAVATTCPGRADLLFTSVHGGVAGTFLGSSRTRTRVPVRSSVACPSGYAFRGRLGTLTARR